MKFGIYFLLILFCHVNAYAACTSPNATESIIDYHNASSKYRYCNGTSWVSMKVGFIPLGMCNNPGEMQYDKFLHYYKWCDGTFIWPASLPGLPGIACSEGSMWYNKDNHKYEFCGGLNIVSIP